MWYFVTLRLPQRNVRIIIIMNTTRTPSFSLFFASMTLSLSKNWDYIGVLVIVSTYSSSSEYKPSWCIHFPRASSIHRMAQSTITIPVFTFLFSIRDKTKFWDCELQVVCWQLTSWHHPNILWVDIIRRFPVPLNFWVLNFGLSKIEKSRIPAHTRWTGSGSTWTHFFVI